MTRFTRVFGLLLGLAMGLGSGAAPAEVDGPDFYVVRGVARDDVLNMRAEPNPQARKVGEIPPDGTCIRNLGCKGGLTFAEFTELSPAEQKKHQRENPRWCKVEYQGVAGWVAGRYLGEGDCRR
ncbi:MAG: SH3 domain-containing protein [Candidatus Contendobacter sp.]|nr:SH3 domain-containing protein [Candidatus Contendobacter sp.]